MITGGFLSESLCNHREIKKNSKHPYIFFPKTNSADITNNN